MTPVFAQSEVDVAKAMRIGAGDAAAGVTLAADVPRGHDGECEIALWKRGVTL